MAPTVASTMRCLAAAMSALLVVAVAHQAEAQTGDSTEHRAGLWLVYNGQHAISSRWAILAEAQLRRTDFASRPSQYLLRPGLMYTWSDKVSLAAGYTYLRTSPAMLLSDPIPTDEHRAFQQITVEYDIGRTALSHRFRAEQRWEQETNTGALFPRVTGRTFDNRGRYQLRATRPLHPGAADDPGWYATVTEEPFLRWGPEGGRSFDQNRFFAGIGHRWSDAVRVEAGYLHQYRRASEGIAREMNHVFQISLYSEAAFRTPK